MRVFGGLLRKHPTFSEPQRAYPSTRYSRQARAAGAGAADRCSQLEERLAKMHRRAQGTAHFLPHLATNLTWNRCAAPPKKAQRVREPRDSCIQKGLHLWVKKKKKTL